MSIEPGLSREEFAALVSSYLREAGIDVVLSGGSCVSIYSVDRYVTKDLDFIDISLKSNRQIGKVLADLGFVNEPRNSRHFMHPAIVWTIEFPSPPLTVGDEHIPESAVAERETAQGVLRMLSPTDCVKDRLANFYYFKDRQCLEQAVLVAKNQPIDLDALEAWHHNEGQKEGYEAFVLALRRAPT